MQFTTRNSDEIRAGKVSLTFRNWRKPHARVGGVYRLRPSGAVRVTEVGTVTLGDVAPDECRRAGFESVTALAAFLKLPRTARVTRVAFEPAGDDELRRPPELTVEEVVERLRATDLRSARPWTTGVLTLIDAHPGVRAGDIAPATGWETPKFKANVRRLKALGLTRSLEVGYRLTDLGTRTLDRIVRRP